MSDAVEQDVVYTFRGISNI